MTTVIINNTKKGKLVLDLIKEMGCGEIIHSIPNHETIEAIEDARNAKLIKAKSAKDLCNELGI